MLTLEDCIALCDLTREEIAAIAEHEHLPEIAALEFGNYLVHQPNGVPAIKRMILGDIEAAQLRGDRAHALALKLVLHHFCRAHRRELSRIGPSADDIRGTVRRLGKEAAGSHHAGR
jgi:hypothetical protein